MAAPYLRPIIHWTDSGYMRGCRLECCRSAHKAALAKWRHNAKIAKIEKREQEEIELARESVAFINPNKIKDWSENALE